MTISGQYLTIPGLVAGVDLSAWQFCPVKLSSTATRTVVKATATTDLMIGILMNDPTSGKEALVAGVGFVKAKAGTSTITRGARLSANSTGVIGSTTDNVKSVGVAMDASAAVGDLIMVHVQGQTRY